MKNGKGDPKPEEKRREETPNAGENPNSDPVRQRIEALMKEVRNLKPGGDLEGLLERATAGIKQEIYQAATRERTQAAAKADFSPSAM